MPRYIDADALMNKIGKILSEHLTIGVVATEIIDAIKDAPTIEPKQGKWIDDDKHNHKYHRCSVCGIGRFNWGEDNFCPNCGAKMKGESDAEDSM